MKNIKKISIIALALALVLGALTACGGGSSDSGEDSADKTIKVTGYAIQSANLNTDQALTELGLG